MNLILTTTCNKNCSFCFANNKEDRNQFDLEKLKEMIMSTSPEEVVKLIGGEPTLYKDFVPFMEFLSTLPNGVVLISNFLIYKPEVKEAIKRFQKVKPLNFLLNASETTEKQYQTMVKNIKELVFERKISLGFTFTEGRTFEDYKQWLDRFHNDVGDKIQNIRTSVTFPATGNNEDFYIYKNYDLADKFYKFIEYAFEKKVGVTIDCGIFPCMFEHEWQYDNIRFWVKESNGGCTGGAFDIFPDGSATLCYPRKDITINAEKHKGNMTEAFEHLLFKKRYEQVNMLNYPKECRTCKFLGTKCDGPCLGFCKMKK